MDDSHSSGPRTYRRGGLWEHLLGRGRAGAGGVMPVRQAAALFFSETWQKVAELGLELQGAHALWAGSAWAVDDGRWQYRALRCRGNTIQGGTSEIMRNIIAERVLGLPKD